MTDDAKMTDGKGIPGPTRMPDAFGCPPCSICLERTVACHTDLLMPQRRACMRDCVTCETWHGSLVLPCTSMRRPRVEQLRLPGVRGKEEALPRWPRRAVGLQELASNQPALDRGRGDGERRRPLLERARTAGRRTWVSHSFMAHQYVKLGSQTARCCLTV